MKTNNLIAIILILCSSSIFAQYSPELDVQGTDDAVDGAEFQLATPSESNFLRFYSGRTEDPSPFLYFSQQDTFRIASGLVDFKGFKEHLSIYGNGPVKISGRLDLINDIKNTVIGHDAGFNMGTDAQANTLLGYEAGKSDISGRENTFIGYQAGYSNQGIASSSFDTPGNRNSSLGFRAGYLNESGFDNSFFGFKAGESTIEDRNVFVGAYTGLTNSTGEKNTYLGTAAGEFGNGSQSIMVGFWAGRFNSGSNNSFLGTRSGYNATGSNNVFIGYKSGFDESGNDLLYIENSSSGTPLIWGDFANDAVQINGDLCYTGSFGLCSDIRFKKDIRVIKNPLARLRKVRGINHQWRHDEFKHMVWSDQRELGVIAQEVETEFPELVKEDRNGYKYVDYIKFTPILIEAINEQQSMIEELRQEIMELKKKWKE